MAKRAFYINATRRKCWPILSVGFLATTLAQELSANARRRAQETHDREKNAREVLAVYEELCGLWGAAQKEEEK